MIKFRAWFPTEQRMLHFSNYEFCDEYDTLTFNLVEQDKTIEYEHLAGKSYIPNSKGILMLCIEVDKNGKEVYEDVV